MRMRTPEPARADAYVAPFRESGEPRAVAGQVVQRVWLCACTADCPRGRSWLPQASVPAALPAACVHARGPSYLLRFRSGQGLHCSQDVLPLRRAWSYPQIESPGTLGGGGMGNLGRKLRRTNGTRRFIKTSSVCTRTASHVLSCFGKLWADTDFVTIL